MNSLHKSHVCNSWQLRYRLLASLAVDTRCSKEIRVVPDLLTPMNPESVSIQSSIDIGMTHCIIQQVLAEFRFKHRYRFLSIYNELKNLSANYPALCFELVLLSDLLDAPKLEFLKKIAIKSPNLLAEPHVLYHLKRLYSQLRSDICSHETNPLILNIDNIEYLINKYPQYGCYLGVSAGHLMYLFDFLVLDNGRTRATVYMGPESLYSMQGVTPKKLSDRVTIVELMSEHTLAQYQDVYLDDEICLYAQLAKAAGKGQINVTSKASLDSNYNRIRYRQSCMSVNLKQSILGSVKIHNQVISFFNRWPHIVCIHNRDAAFSGGSELRNTSLRAYSSCIHELILRGHGIVLLSMATEYKFPEHTQILDFSCLDYSALDQVYCLSNASELIGTASGISHLWTVSGIKTIFVNTTALPSTHVTDSVIHSPKRLVCRCKHYSFGFPKMVQSILNSTWDERLKQYFEIISLSDNELLEEYIKWSSLISSDSYEGFPTAHKLWKSLIDDKPDFPDYYLTTASFNNLRIELSRQSRFT